MTCTFYSSLISIWFFLLGKNCFQMKFVSVLFSLRHFDLLLQSLSLYLWLKRVIFASIYQIPSNFFEFYNIPRGLCVVVMRTFSNEFSMGQVIYIRHDIHDAIMCQNILVQLCIPRFINENWSHCWNAMNRG